MHAINTVVIAGYVDVEPVAEQGRTLASMSLRLDSGDVVNVLCTGMKAEFVRDRVRVGSGIHVSGQLRQFGNDLVVLADQISVVEQPARMQLRSRRPRTVTLN